MVSAPPALLPQWTCSFSFLLSRLAIFLVGPLGLPDAQGIRQQIDMTAIERKRSRQIIALGIDQAGRKPQ